MENKRPESNEKGWTLDHVIETKPEWYVYKHKDGRTYETRTPIKFNEPEPVKRKSEDGEDWIEKPEKLMKFVIEAFQRQTDAFERMNDQLREISNSIDDLVVHPNLEDILEKQVAATKRIADALTIKALRESYGEGTGVMRENARKRLWEYEQRKVKKWEDKETAAKKKWLEDIEAEAIAKKEEETWRKEIRCTYPDCPNARLKDRLYCSCCLLLIEAESDSEDDMRPLSERKE